MSEVPHCPVSEADERGFWTKLGRVAARIPFTSDLLAAWFCAADPKTPARVRAILMGAIAYFLMPADSVPDFIVAFGFADDATVLAFAISSVAGHIRDEHRERALDAVRRLSD